MSPNKNVICNESGSSPCSKRKRAADENVKKQSNSPYDKKTNRSEWSLEDEVSLLYASIDNRPIGAFKNIQKALIAEQFMTMSKREVQEEDLWSKYGEWYNLDELDKREMLPFDNSVEDYKFPAEMLSEEELKQFKDAKVENVLDYDKDNRLFTVLNSNQNKEINETVKIIRKKRPHSIKPGRVNRSSGSLTNKSELENTS